MAYRRILKGIAELGALHLGHKLEAFFTRKKNKKRCNCKWYCKHRKHLTPAQRKAIARHCRRD